ncbi:MAG: transaldolase [Phycisphaerae bacterium]
MNHIVKQIFEVGQSIWCDNISRAMIDQGGLQKLIDEGIVGVTSNPTIFMKAITGGTDYDELLAKLHGANGDNGNDQDQLLHLYEGLVVPDIADAADILRPVYDRTDGVDGFISLEVNPKLAYDTDATVAEARRLFAELNRPNIFIKVPATEEGVPAIETLISEGINVNVTLIFSLQTYEKVMAAYINGLAKRKANGGDITRVASVASFFVSRVDGLVDKRLSDLKAQGQSVDRLMGRAAIANARLAYARFLEVFGSGSAFDELRKAGARVQRPLWASTSTKNPDYPDTLYCDALVAPDTVNTLPPATIDAVMDHGKTGVAIPSDVSEERDVVKALNEIGISMDEVTETLRADGVDAFVESFQSLLDDLARKRDAIRVG